MASSRVPALIDALVAALQASVDLSGVNIVDGPLVSNSAAAEWVFVGYDGDPGGEGQATSTQQQWAGIGAKAKNEEISLTCAVLVRSGSTDVKPLRDRAYQIFAAAEAVVRADPALTLPPPTVCDISDHNFFAEQTAQGLQGRLPFTITCTTRI